MSFIKMVKQNKMLVYCKNEFIRSYRDCVAFIIVGVLKKFHGYNGNIKSYCKEFF